MASRKITEYTALTTPASDDVLPIIDISETAANQNKKITIPNLTGQLSAASTSAAGIVQLNDTTASTSTSQAATANAVKAAYDLANAALPKAGGTMTGVITYASTQPRLVQETAKASTSGTAVDFTDIPSWAMRITVMFSGVSLSGSSRVMIQLGDAGGIETSGYTGSVTVGTTSRSFSSGFLTVADGTPSASNRYSGIATLCNMSQNVWTIGGTIGRIGDENCYLLGGSKTLSATLDRVRIASENGSTTFDAGTINILYEG